MQVMSKVIESKAAEFQSRRKKESSPNGSSSRSPPQHANANAEDLEDNEDNENANAGDIINQRKYYEALIGKSNS